jgi:hypothetical protein
LLGGEQLDGFVAGDFVFDPLEVPPVADRAAVCPPYGKAGRGAAGAPLD